MHEQGRNQGNMGRNDISTKGRFFNLLEFVFQKPYDYLVLDRDNNEYYRKFNKISIIGNDATETKNNT